MNLERRKNIFFLTVFLAWIYCFFVLDVSLDDYSWPIRIGFIGAIYTFYMIFIMFPFYSGELDKQMYINSHLTNELSDLRDELSSLKCKLQIIESDIDK